MLTVRTHPALRFNGNKMTAVASIFKGGGAFRSVPDEWEMPFETLRVRQHMKRAKRPRQGWTAAVVGYRPGRARRALTGRVCWPEKVTAEKTSTGGDDAGTLSTLSYHQRKTRSFGGRQLPSVLAAKEAQRSRDKHHGNKGGASQFPMSMTQKSEVAGRVSNQEAGMIWAEIKHRAAASCVPAETIRLEASGGTRGGTGGATKVPRYPEAAQAGHSHALQEEVKQGRGGGHRVCYQVQSRREDAAVEGITFARRNGRRESEQQADEETESGNTEEPRVCVTNANTGNLSHDIIGRSC